MYILVSKVFIQIYGRIHLVSQSQFFSSLIFPESFKLLSFQSPRKKSISLRFSQESGEKKSGKISFGSEKSFLWKHTPSGKKNKNFTLHFSISLTDRQPRASRNRSHVFSQYVGGYLLFSPKRRNCFVYSRRIWWPIQLGEKIEMNWGAVKMFREDPRKFDPHECVLQG